MKAIYLDCFSGVSGNMLLGAFLEAGVSKDYIIGELNKLPMAGEFAFPWWKNAAFMRHMSI